MGGVNSRAAVSCHSRASWLGILGLRGLGEFSPSGIAYGVRQGSLSRRRRVQVDERGAFGVVPHPGHEFPEVRARVDGELVSGVPQVVKMNALQADGGQGGKPHAVAEIRVRQR